MELLEAVRVAHVDMVPMAAALVFCLMDVAVGLVKAFATKSFQSGRMREGLAHKAGSILTIVLGYAIEIAVRLVDFHQIGIDIRMDMPIGPIAAGYVVLMEASSMLESLCEINPELGRSGVMRAFSGVKGAADAAAGDGADGGGADA